MEDIFNDAKINSEEMDDVTQKITAAEILFNQDDAESLFYYFFEDPDEFTYLIYKANIYGDTTNESGSIHITRTKNKIIVFIEYSWSGNYTEYYSVEDFNTYSVIDRFIIRSEDFTASDFC